MKRMIRTTSNPRGYTLIEMIVVLFISIITLVAVVSATMLFYKSNTKTLNQGYTVESARQGVQNAVADIRGIQYGADGSYPIFSIATTSIIFYSDTNGDGVAERVRYYLYGTNFVRGIVKSSGNPPVYVLGSEATTTMSVAVRNVQENIPIFRYFTASSTEIINLSTTTPIAYVTLTLIVNQNTATTTGDYTLRSTAALRNTSQF